MTTPASNLSLTVTLDKDVYKPGDEITVTLDLTQLAPLTVTGSGTDANGATVSGTAEASVVEPAAAPVTFGITDSLGTVYTQQSADGGEAVMTGTIPGATAP